MVISLKQVISKKSTIKPRRGGIILTTQKKTSTKPRRGDIIIQTQKNTTTEPRRGGRILKKRGYPKDSLLEKESNIY